VGKFYFRVSCLPGGGRTVFFEIFCFPQRAQRRKAHRGHRDFKKNAVISVGNPSVISVGNFLFPTEGTEKKSPQRTQRF